MALSYEATGYDRATGRLKVCYEVPAHRTASVKQIAGIAPSERGMAFDHALRLGGEAAAALARIPDDAQLHRADDRALAELDTAGADLFATKLGHLVAHYRSGGALDSTRAAPAELLAWCIARAAAG